jgi:hypothetical protein
MKSVMRSLIVGLMLLSLTGCGKSATDLLTEKPWKVNSLKLGGMEVIGLIPGLTTISLTIAKDGNFSLNAGVLFNQSGTWTLSQDEKQLLVTSEEQVTTWDILLLEEGVLKMQTTLSGQVAVAEATH